MTKADLVQEISKQTGIDRNEVLMIVEAFMETVKGSLSNGKNVYLRGFGSFIIKRKAEKTGRNIGQNTTLIILLLNFKIQFALISIVIQHCNTVHLMYQEKQGLQ